MIDVLPLDSRSPETLLAQTATAILAGANEPLVAAADDRLLRYGPGSREGRIEALIVSIDALRSPRSCDTDGF